MSSLEITNKYFDLATGPLDVEASSIINGIAAQDGMSLGEVVGLAPIGGGITQTPVGSLLPRFERTVASEDPGFGVIVGGDLDGVYANGSVPVNSAGFPLESIVANRGDGIRVCIQGRCLAQVDGLTTGNIVPGDNLSADKGIYVKQSSTGTATKAIALQSTTVDNSIIAVDIQREGGFPDFTGFKQLVTIAKENISGSVGTFQVLVSITGNQGLIDNAQADGFDIFFTTETGNNRIPYERESFDKDNGDLVAWVKVDSLTSTTDTKFFMNYGLASTVDQQQPLAVWKSTYEQVFHFGQTGGFPWINSVQQPFGNINLSSGTNISGTAAGQIDLAVPLTTAGTLSQTSLQLIPNPFGYTLTAWIRKTQESTTTDDFIEYFNTAFRSASFARLKSGDVPNSKDVLLTISIQGTEVTNKIGEIIVDGDSHFIGITITGTGQLTVNFDGTSANLGSIGTVPPDIGDMSLGGGVNSSGATILATLDEFRVTEINLGSDYIQNCFLNQQDNGSGVGQGQGGFLSLGAET